MRVTLTLKFEVRVPDPSCPAKTSSLRFKGAILWKQEVTANT